ncbi:MAG: dTDP-4-dehydrorhamnose reductase [Pseudomonadota bacterium]
MTARDVLILGGGGQVGQMLQRIAWPDGVTLHAPARDAVDLADPDAIARIVAERPWALVVNAAAYTAVDKAESDVAAAWMLNAVAPAVLAAETARAGIPLVHLSTDYVFDGSKDAPYAEGDPIAPLGVYGASKEGGEQGVRTGNPQHVILRTAWVYGPDRANFVKTMLRVGKDRPELKVVADQVGCPTSTADIAAGIRAVAEAIWAGEGRWGTYHLAGTGEASWHAFAAKVFEAVGSRWTSRPTVHPIPTSEYPTPAARPANSRLDCAKLERDYGFRARPWETALTETVDALLAND